ncbi:MAG: NUDIX domain-containing protein [Clostridium saccharoperbutylacetonicum]
MMKELLTVYNEQLEVVGKLSRDEIHKKGLKHKVVHCWIIERGEIDSYLYFQQRSFNKSDFPGMYDIACAGHIDAGEEAEIAMIRELDEEIGLNINKNDLKYIGRKFESFQKGEFFDNEICEMYLLEVKNNTKFILGDEVEDMVRVSLIEYEKWINKELKELEVSSIEGNKKVVLKDDNICPHIREYNDRLLEAVYKGK